MDDLDHRLIALLRTDARASLSQLAKALGVSRGTVQNRLDKLIAADVILGFTVRLKNAATPDRIRAIMMVEVSGKNSRRVAHELRGLPQIHALFSTNGPFDLIAEIECANLEEFDRLLSSVRTIEGIARSETSLLLAPA
ncbi:Lrp/AsnC family transcriptional regulator [Methylocystis sp. B8]|uniref:Lrp/AsnC family transcriptional regulator n=1 Tax=Methylocystis sp. B8 TaxID=544938 RepID=UPI0010FEBA6A|nr:Lrp/AsnC family transcriptional regulator [Methylocystis sp. B8]TLG78194.1 Lrp/AsnC family transcriptional regulator [Methylocystis sp. B8]